MRTEDIQGRAWIFAVLFLVSALALVGTSYSLFRLAARNRISALREAEHHAIGMRTDEIRDVLQSAVADLLFLAELNELDAFLSSGSEDALTKEFLAFARQHEAYKEIWIIPEDDVGAVGCTAADEEPRIIISSADETPATANLPDTGMVCPEGTVYVSGLSSFHSSSSAEGIEHPQDLVLHIGTWVNSADGTSSGFLTLSILADAILDRYTRGHSDSLSYALLATQDGLVLHSADDDLVLPATALGPMGFAEAFPSEWTAIEASSEGQFETANGLFTYSTFRPSQEAHGNEDSSVLDAIDEVPPEEDAVVISWKAFSWVPAPILAGMRLGGVAGLVAWNAFGVLSLAVIAWFIAERLARRAAMHRRTAADKTLLSSALSRYIPKIPTETLLREPHRYATPGGEPCEAAVLFADIRGFTGFAEVHDAQHVISVLNIVLAKLTPALDQNCGVLDKYLGDGFLAFFPSSPNLTDAAQRAVQTAQDIQEAFAGLRQTSIGPDLRDMGLGVGVSLGSIVLGNVGSQNSMDFTVIGDTVNVAARVQASARAGEILVTEGVHNLLAESGRVQSRVLELRGRRAPVTVYSIATQLRRQWLGNTTPRVSIE